MSSFHRIYFVSANFVKKDPPLKITALFAGLEVVLDFMNFKKGHG